ncbi:MAG: hypothetical protein EHM21_10425, partial [Chloroflexi bacterium]
YYLRQSQRGSGIELVIFSTPYALMGYVLVFSHNIMWLDGVIFLPLIALGIEKLVREGRFGLYWAALALMLAANYYIGFMLCIFSALYFAAQSALCFERGQARVLLRRLGLFSAASLLSAGSAAFLLLPTYFGLSTGKMIFSRASFDLVPKFNPLDLLPKLLPGSYDMTFSNLPTLYCGILMVLLAGLFFFSPAAARRQKIVSAGLLAVLLVSLFLSGLDLLWHGFALPTGFHYRYVFLLVFLVIQLAHQAFRGLGQISLRALAGGFALGLGLLAVIKLRGAGYLPDDLLLAAVILLCAYAALLWLIRRGTAVAGTASAGTAGASARLLTLLLAGVVLLEAGLNTLVDLRKTHQEFGYKDRAAYTSYNALLEPVIAEIQRSDAGFYRIEKTFFLSVNDALGLGYRVVTHYSSSFNRPVLTFLKEIGFFQPYYRALYTGQSLPVDSILGIKYLLTGQPSLNGYPQVAQSPGLEGQIFTSQNTYALPLGFMVSPALEGVQITASDPAHPGSPIAAQEQILQAMLGAEPGTGDFFIPLAIQETRLENLTARRDGEQTRFAPKSQGLDAWIEYRLRVEREDPLYAFLPAVGSSKMEVSLDGKLLGFFGENSENNHLIVLGQYPPGTELTLRLKLMSKEATLLDGVPFYQLDRSRFTQAYQDLSAHALEITTFSDTRVSASVQVPADRTLLFTSIPYDEGWSLRVDGKETPKIRLLGALTGVELAEGIHSI